MSGKFLSDNEIGRRIRDAREARGWTQAELADAVGLGGKKPQGRISKWERGTEAVPKEHLEKIANHLQTPLGYLVLAHPGEFRPDAEVIADWLDARSEELREQASRSQPSKMALVSLVKEGRDQQKEDEAVEETNGGA